MDKNSYLIDLSESDHTSFGRVGFSEQGLEQRVFSAIWALESQVNNGGFAQYFLSSDGETAHFASTALRTIGAVECAQLVERAVMLVSPSAPLPADQEGREVLVEALPEESIEALEQLDTQFYSYPDNLTELLFAYVAAHPNEFGQVPSDA